MTPRAVRLGLVRWVRVTREGAVTGRCVASSRDLARDALPCGDGEWVESYDSHRLGHPRALKAGRCIACGVRGKAHAETPYCVPCGSAEHRAAQTRHRVKTGPGTRRSSASDSLRRSARSPEKRAKMSAAMRLVWAKRKGVA